MALFRRSSDVTPLEDWGFFGPGSMTWKVWSYPTGLTVGFQRSVVVEELDPNLVASVDATGDIFTRPRTRYDRTLRYFAMVAFGDTRSTSRAADVLVRIHSKGQGIEPYGRQPYDANDPDSQLWIHLTAWHSILYAYEVYGPGPLSPEQEAQYWHECAVAAELQTCSPDAVPRTREGVREYFEQMKPQLSGSELARKAMNHLLRADVMLPPMPTVLRPLTLLITRVLRAGTIATMPRWMRQMSGLSQPAAVDLAVRPILRTAFWLVSRSPRVELALLSLLSPSTVPVVAPMKLGIEPERRETLTPAEARARYGYDRPRDAHLELRSRQRDKALAGQAPSDEGIIESVPILGATG